MAGAVPNPVTAPLGQFSKLTELAAKRQSDVQHSLLQTVLGIKKFDEGDDVQYR